MTLKKIVQSSESCLWGRKKNKAPNSKFSGILAGPAGAWLRENDRPHVPQVSDRAPLLPWRQAPRTHVLSSCSSKNDFNLSSKISKQSFYICPVWVLAKANHAEEDSKQECLIKLHSVSYNCQGLNSTRRTGACLPPTPTPSSPSLGFFHSVWKAERLWDPFALCSPLT